MTGAIISEYYYKSTEGATLRHFAITGSFFFIEPDVAITTYANLCEERSVLGGVYAEDYLYFGEDCNLLNIDLKSRDLIKCLWLDREWLKEKPDKNITEIHFGKAVSRSFFRQSENPIHKGIEIIGEGYNGNQFIHPRENNNIEFLQFSRSQEEKFSLFRAMGKIDGIVEDECFSAGKFNVSGIPIIYTSLYPVVTMAGGPILESVTNNVVGILSHESNDPYEKAGMRAILL